MGGIGGRSGGGRDRGRQQQQQQQQMEQQIQGLPAVQMAGTVDAVVPGWIRVLSESNQPWVFQVRPTAKCKLTGKANPDALAPGYYVRFVGEVNKRGAVEQKVAKLTIFTPSQFRQPGAEPDLGFGTSFGARAGEERKAEGGAKPAGFGAGAADAGRAPAGARKAGAGGKGGAPELYDIRGQIVGVSNGRLSVHVPNAYFRPSLRVEVAEDADIDVELDDARALALARKGDKVRIQGRQSAGNRGFAEDLDIILGDPLGAPQADAKKHGAKSAKGKRGAEADEPAETKPADGKGAKKDADPSAPKGKKAEAGKGDSAGDDVPEKPARKKTKKPAKTDAGDDA
jgi:hypothetical protein